MTWLSIITVLLRLVNGIVSYMQQRQLIEAGKAEQIKDNVNATLSLVNKADAAAAAATDAFDKRGSLPDDKDPNLRD